MYVLVTSLSGVNLFLEHLRRDNLGSFIDNEPFRPTALYYSSYLLFYGIVLFVAVLCAKLHFEGLRSSSALSFRFRTSLGLLSFLLICFAALVVLGNLTISMLYGDTYRPSINKLYHALKPLVGLAVATASAPAGVIAFLLQPFIIVQRKRQAKEQELTRYLHSRIAQITPTVRLSSEQPSTLRCQVEIDDARELIWSHQQGQQRISAQAEATLLWKLLLSKTTFHTVGTHEPPSTHHHVLKHNRLVAKYLKRLEHRYNKKHADVETTSKKANPSSPWPPLSR